MAEPYHGPDGLRESARRSGPGRSATVWPCGQRVALEWTFSRRAPAGRAAACGTAASRPPPAPPMGMPAPVPGGLPNPQPMPYPLAASAPRPAPPSSPMAGSRGDWLDVICPYLRAADGTWRSAVPAREHRCWAFEPVIELPGLTQQRLCLTQAHADASGSCTPRSAAPLPLRATTSRPSASRRLVSGRSSALSRWPSNARRRVVMGPARCLRASDATGLPFLLLGGAAIGILLVAAIIIFGGFLDKGTGIVLPTSSPTHAAATPAGPASPAPLDARADRRRADSTAIPTPTRHAGRTDAGPDAGRRHAHTGHDSASHPPSHPRPACLRPARRCRRKRPSPASAIGSRTATSCPSWR